MPLGPNQGYALACRVRNREYQNRCLIIDPILRSPSMESDLQKNVEMVLEYTSVRGPDPGIRTMKRKVRTI